MKIPRRDIEVEEGCVQVEAFEAVVDHGHSGDGEGREEREREKEEQVQSMKGWAPSPVLSVGMK